VDAAGLVNTPVLVEQATADPRYGAAKNAAVPRKIGSKLWLYDCINCDKCVPVCPNDANFVYDGPPIEVPYDDVELGSRGEVRALRDDGGVFRIATGHQLANYADACNDCGNCDVFCPEDGGPYVEKPRFFGSLESYKRHAGRNGFYVETNGPRRSIHGTVDGKRYRVELDPASGRARYDDGVVEAEVALETNRVVGARFKEQSGHWLHRIEMRPFLTLRYLAEAVSDPRHVHFVNVAGL
jgi:putative selenate reductase